MTKYYLLFLFIYILASCNPGSNKTAPIMDEKQFVQLMAEIYLLDAHFNELPGPIKDSISKIKLNEILRSYKISEDDFKLLNAQYSKEKRKQEDIEEQIIKLVKDSAAIN